MNIPDNERQIIIYGAPGTGKSYYINQQLGGKVVSNKQQLEGKAISKENQFRTTFHPDSDYSTFVGAYKPTMDGETIKYKFVPQVFLKAYVRAYQASTEKVYLIIEEINRGNCAQIFGDIFQLLDRNDEGRSEYEIDADEDIKAYLEEKLGKDSDGIKGGKLCLPSNLYIYATMNTSDQSLFPIDSAFKRRWYWVYSPIKYDNTKWVIKIDDSQYSWTSFQKVVNDKIFKATNSEDKMLGDFFVKPNGNEISKEMFRDKILFYLWNDVCKDGSGDIFVDKDNNPITFSSLYNGEEGDKKLIAIMEHLKKDDNWGITDNEGQNSNSPKDYTKYSINKDNTEYPKSKLPTELVKLYIKKNQNLSDKEIIDNLKKLFKGLGSNAIEEPDAWDKRKATNKESLSNFIDKEGNSFDKKTSDTFICVANNIWNKDNIPTLIERGQSWGLINEIKQS